MEKRYCISNHNNINRPPGWDKTAPCQCPSWLGFLMKGRDIMIISERQAERCFQIALRKLHRKFPELTKGCGELAEHKIIEEKARNQWIKALSAPEVEKNVDKYSSFSVLKQSTGYAYRCLVRETRLLVEAIVNY